MAVSAAAASVIVRNSTIEARFPGGLPSFAASSQHNVLHGWQREPRWFYDQDGSFVERGRGDYRPILFAFSIRPEHRAAFIAAHR